MPISDTEPFAPGTVVVVPFPYSDRLAEKRRPAVVVSGPVVARAGFVWIAMITSARNVAASGDLPIENLDAAGLATASMVRPLKIACIEPTRIVRAIGALDADEAEAVYACLRSMIGPVRTAIHPDEPAEPTP